VLPLIKVRDKRRSNISSLGRFFQNVPFEDILSSVQSPCEKLTIFTDIINYGLNTIMPERSIKVHVTDRPWMTNNLKRLINKRQKAFAMGNKPLFSLLRNKVNRELSALFLNHVQLMQLSQCYIAGWPQQTEQVLR
jgi:hypothetical protein